MERLLENLFYRLFFVMKLSMIYVVLLLAGGIIFGVTPANATILYFYRQHRSTVENYRLSETWQYYKKVFLSTNAVFLVIALTVGVLSYGLYLLVQYQNAFTIILSILNTFLALFCAMVYPIYLKLQIYYDFNLVNALKLSTIAIFFNVKALAKLLVGSAICLFILSKVSLIVAVFIPVLWLMFIFDILEPIYQRVASYYPVEQ